MLQTTNKPYAILSILLVSLLMLPAFSLAGITIPTSKALATVLEQVETVYLRPENNSMQNLLEQSPDGVAILIGLIVQRQKRIVDERMDVLSLLKFDPFELEIKQFLRRLAQEHNYRHPENGTQLTGETLENLFNRAVNGEANAYYVANFGIDPAVVDVDFMMDQVDTSTEKQHPHQNTDGLTPAGGAITLLGQTTGKAQQPVTARRVGKEPLPGGKRQDPRSQLYRVSPVDPQCVDDCMRRNQMHSVGFEVIQRQCLQECDIDRLLELLQTAQGDEYAAAVKALAEIDAPRVVQPLITALKRDQKERTGLWAWIIPALGEARDSAAVPILEQTLRMDDDDWLGREMSARALGNIGAPAAIPALLAAAWRADTRAAALEALAKFHDKRVIPALLSALGTDEEPRTRAAAVAGLGSLGAMAVPEMIRSFSAAYSPEDPETEKRLSLCQLLGNSGSEAAVNRLEKSLSDPDPAIRQCAGKYISSQR